MYSKTGNLYLDNKMLNELEIKQEKIVLESKLRKLIVVLTNKCNLRCIMCTRKAGNLSLPSEVMKQVRETFPYLDFISWQGGEVFLVDYFKQILEEASRYPHIQQEITTNGTLITKEWAELIARANVRLIFSMDSLTKETYEYIRKGARFEDALEGISLLREARKNYSKPKPLDFINIVVMRSNYRELEKFVDFALNSNFDGLNFIYLDDTLVPQENIFKPLDLEAVGYLRKAIPNIFNNAKHYGIVISCEFASLLSDSTANNDSDSVKQPLLGKDELLCLLPWMRICIDCSRGGAEVFPECLCERSVGNLLENTLDEIWNNELMQLYRRKILSNTYANWCSDRCVKGMVNKDFLRGC